jgi:hypothetical protein
MVIASHGRYSNLLTVLKIIKNFLEDGARLDLGNADGETALENAAHWTFLGITRHWNLAPILLLLQK